MNVRLICLWKTGVKRYSIIFACILGKLLVVKRFQILDRNKNKYSTKMSKYTIMLNYMRKRLFSLRTFREQTRDISRLNHENFLTEFLSSSPNIYLAICTAAYDILAASKMNHKKRDGF
jgi:hypothetical protein